MEGWKKAVATLFVFAGIVLLCGASAYIGSDFGRAQGFSEGTQAGNQASYKQGHKDGQEEGYEAGYNSGYEIGVRETGSGFDLHDPTYEEMKQFLENDDTDSNEFVEDSYVCTDFSAAVNNAAESLGIRCAIVYIIYPEAGHTIVAFETVDRGRIYIEPQFDHEVKIKIGENYSSLNGYSPPNVDDHIQRFLVIW